jgi:Uma2 family endonuclease
MATRTLLTGEDLLKMRDGEKSYELVRGELIEMPPPGIVHGRRASRIAWLLEGFVQQNDLGIVCVESGFYIERDPDTVRGPDVMFFSRDRLDPDAEIEGYPELPPDLAVEIVSPSDSLQSILEKVEEYLRAGVRLVWVVYERSKSVTVYPSEVTLDEEDSLEGGDVLPGFSVQVSALFRRR